MASESTSGKNRQNSSASDDEDTRNGPQVESLVAGRERRATAGKRMAQLLEAEENDDAFYQQAFGADVFEIGEDDEYTSEDEEDSEDVFDSDFETDDEQERDASEAASAAQLGSVEDEELRKKRQAYSDPLKKKGRIKRLKKSTSAGKKLSSTTFARHPRDREETQKIRRENELKLLKPSDGYVDQSLPSSTTDAVSTRRSTRTATVKSQTTQQQAAKKPQRPSRPAVPKKKITLEDRLREAVETERLNLASLHRYKQSEIRKKKRALRERTYKGFIFRTQSSVRNGQLVGSVSLINLTAEGNDVVNA